MRRATAGIGIFICLCGPLSAQMRIDLDAAETCFSTAATDGTDPATCIDQLQATCMDQAAETPAVAAQCFDGARTEWSQALAARMAAFVRSADERLAAIARIETKYDLLSGLLQCDRGEELAIAASDLSGETIARQKLRCQATAAALSYMRLYLRTSDMP